jgi:hypothetical protein
MPIAGVAPAKAQAAVDKSGYTVFDPAPDDQLRAFCTDRPPKANLPCTVDAGHWQYESDVVELDLRAHWRASRRTLVLFTNPTIKLGLTNTGRSGVEHGAARNGQQRECVWPPNIA